MIQDVLKDAEGRMGKAMDALRRDLAGIRTGRASPSLVDRLTVEYYGTPTPLNQLAGVSVPEPRLLVIQPWDRGTMGAIEKAIQKSELGLNPSNDGQVIRIPIPPLTEERRKQLVKMVRSRAEEARVGIRNVRRHAKEGLGQLEKGGEISQDDERRAEQELQQLTDRHVAEVDSMLQHKEQEMMEV